jgi:hypothetical protein
VPGYEWETVGGDAFRFQVPEEWDEREDGKWVGPSATLEARYDFGNPSAVKAAEDFELFALSWQDGYTRLRLDKTPKSAKGKQAELEYTYRAEGNYYHGAARTIIVDSETTYTVEFLVSAPSEAGLKVGWKAQGVHRNTVLNSIRLIS